MQRACQNPQAVPTRTPPTPDAPGGQAAAMRAWGYAVLVALWAWSLQAAAAPDPVKVMLAGARQWVSEQRGVRPEAVTFGAIDARIKLPICQDPKGWQYDAPFGNQDTLRARCVQPASQLYLRVSLAGAKVAASTASSDPARQTVETRPVVVLKQGLLRGTRVGAQHLEVQQMPLSQVPLQSIDNVDNAIDAELTRDVLAGKPIRSTDLRPAMLVKRGQTVTLTIRQEGGFSVVAQVEALQDGRKGDSIRLKNRESGRILTGKVVGLLSVEGQ